MTAPVVRDAAMEPALESRPWRILVTGSRDWRDADMLGRALYEEIDASPRQEIVVVHGACPQGADRLAAEFCESETAWLEPAGTGLVEEPHPADWSTHGRAAGFRRNAEMVDLGADVCLAFVNPCTKRGCPDAQPHGSHGASHTAELAEKAGIRVRRFPQDGDAA